MTTGKKKKSPYSEKVSRHFCRFLQPCFVQHYKDRRGTEPEREEEVRFVMEKIRERYSGFGADRVY